MEQKLRQSWGIGPDPYAQPVVVAPRQNIDWEDLFEMCYRDKGGRWFPNDDTPAAEYVEQNGYRTPSRAWPYSYVKPLLTRKFAKWLREHHPAYADQLNLA